MTKNNYRLYKSNKGNLGKYAFLLINLNNIRLASISSKDRVSQTNDSQMLLRIRNLWKACYNEDCSTPFLIQLVCCRAQEFTFLTGSQKMLKTMIWKLHSDNHCPKLKQTSDKNSYQKMSSPMTEYLSFYKDLGF